VKEVEGVKEVKEVKRESCEGKGGREFEKKEFTTELAEGHGENGELGEWEWFVKKPI
jgi:hypothetical protein